MWRQCAGGEKGGARVLGRGGGGDSVGGGGFRAGRLAGDGAPVAARALWRLQRPASPRGGGWR